MNLLISSKTLFWTKEKIKQVKLSPGDAVTWKDRELLHGRNSFSALESYNISKKGQLTDDTASNTNNMFGSNKNPSNIRSSDVTPKSSTGMINTSQVEIDNKKIINKKVKINNIKLNIIYINCLIYIKI